MSNHFIKVAGRPVACWDLGRKGWKFGILANGEGGEVIFTADTLEEIRKYIFKEKETNDA